MQFNNDSIQANHLQKLAASIILWSKRGLVLLLLLNIVLLVYYICVGYQSFFHSDAAVKNLLAGEIWRTGEFFPSGWNYVNGDLWVVYGHLFILPLLLFFENGYELHAVAGIISSALVLTSAWLIVGVASQSTWTRLVFVAIVASGISGVMAEELFGQGSYGYVFYMACFTVYFAWRFLQARMKARWIWAGGVASVAMLVFWANPQRAVATYALPLSSAALVYVGSELARTSWAWNPRATRGALLLLLVLFGAMVGTVLHQWIIAGVNNAPGAGDARWLTFDGLIKNAGYTVQSLLSALGSVPTATRSVMSIGGLYEGMRFLTGCLLLVMMPIALFRAIHGQRDGLRFVAVFAVVSASIFIFLHATTTIPDMRDPSTSARYLVPSVLFCLLVLVVVVMEAEGSSLFRLLGAGGLLILVTSVISPNNPLSLGLKGAPDDPREPLLELLESNDLHYGYATFWNAGVLSVLSDQDVNVRQIDVQQGMPVPKRHLSSDQWFEPSAWTGRTFLLLNDAEATSVNWNAVVKYAGKPIKTLEYNDLNVYVFQRNLASVMPNWNESLAQPLAVSLSSSSSRTVGNFVGTDGGPGAVVASPGESGYLHFGPYLRLTPGRYKATFKIETAEGRGDNLGVADVTSQQGGTVHASRQLAEGSSPQQIVLRFSLTKDVNDLELRVFSSGAGNMKLHAISLSRDE